MTGEYSVASLADIYCQLPAVEGNSIFTDIGHGTAKTLFVASKFFNKVYIIDLTRLL